MELSEYPIEELRAEIKRRYELAKEQKKQEKRCKNCVHMVSLPNCPWITICDARTWGKKVKRNYSVKPSTKACDKFKNKFE